MTENQSDIMTKDWHGQVFFRTYGLWWLVVITFLIAFSESANIGLMLRWGMRDVSFETYTSFTYLGKLVAGLLSVYFLRKCLKESFLIFTAVYLLSLILLRFGPTTQSEIYLAATFFKNIGHFGIILTILAVLVTARFNLKSFLTAILIIWFWKSIGQFLAGIYGFSYTDLENQILGFHYIESDGDIKPTLQDVFFYNLACLLPAVLAVLSAVLLTPIIFLGRFSLKTKTSRPLPLKTQPSGWLWQDLVSSYRFWGLVLVSFLIGLAYNANLYYGNSYPEAFASEFGQGIYTCIGYAPPFIAGLLTLYFLKGRLKASLIGFSLLILISISFVRLAHIIIPIRPTLNPVSFVVAETFRDIGYYGILLSILSALVTAKLPLKSFFIAFFIIWFWHQIGDILGFSYDNIEFSYTPIGDERTLPVSFIFYQFIMPVLPAAFAVLAALKLSSKLFFSPAAVMIDAKAAKIRLPSEVFFLSLMVPFYFLYWLFKQPGELKTLAPSMHQPSPIGVLCVGLFAPLILPIWFHDVRKGLSPALNDRSPIRIAVASFFLPAIAAGMAQSDYNRIVDDNSKST